MGLPSTLQYIESQPRTRGKLLLSVVLTCILVNMYCVRNKVVHKIYTKVPYKKLVQITLSHSKSWAFRLAGREGRPPARIQLSTPKELYENTSFVSTYHA